MWISQKSIAILTSLATISTTSYRNISVRHTAKLFGGNIGVQFYNVTTLYFETDYEDELRKTGFSKEGRHSNPQIILGLLVSLGGIRLPIVSMRATNMKFTRCCRR